MRSGNLTPEQRRRYEKIRELARHMGNMSLAPVESHLHPYKDLPPARLTSVEVEIRQSFISCLQEKNLVLLWADARARSLISFESAEEQSNRGNMLRLLAKENWFEKNWPLFADDIGFQTRRNIFVLLKYDQASLSRLVAPWWDPNVLVNPAVTTSQALLNEARALLQPGNIVFSLAMNRLRSCEIYFHPDDLDSVTECICTSAHKQGWWKD